MKYEDLPKRWKEKLKVYLKTKKRDTLRADDFDDSSVKVKFDDGSICEFNYAFVIPAPEFDEVGIFTEHCGYHLMWFNQYTAIYVNGKRLPTQKIKSEYEALIKKK